MAACPISSPTWVLGRDREYRDMLKPTPPAQTGFKLARHCGAPFSGNRRYIRFKEQTPSAAAQLCDPSRSAGWRNPR